MQKLGLFRIADGKEGEVENTTHILNYELKVPSASDNRSHPWDFKSSVLWDAIHDSAFITEEAATDYYDKDVWNENTIGEWGSEATPRLLVLERKPFAHHLPEAMRNSSPPGTTVCSTRRPPSISKAVTSPSRRPAASRMVLGIVVRPRVEILARSIGPLPRYSQRAVIQISG